MRGTICHNTVINSLWSTYRLYIYLYTSVFDNWAPDKAACPVLLYWPAGSSLLQAGSCCQWAETSGWYEENCEASKSTRAQCNPPEPKTSLPREKVRLQPKLASLYLKRAVWSAPGDLNPVSYQTKTMVKACSVWGNAHSRTWEKTSKKSRRGSSVVAKWNPKEILHERRDIHSASMSPCLRGPTAPLRPTAAPKAHHTVTGGDARRGHEGRRERAKTPLWGVYKYESASPSEARLLNIHIFTEW